MGCVETVALGPAARALRGCAAALLVLASYAGCSSGSSSVPDLGPIPPAEPVVLAAFCSEYAAALCVGIQNCCPLVSRKYPNVGQCQQHERVRCETELLPIVGSPDVFNPQRAGDLVARLRASGGKCSEPRGRVDIRYIITPEVPGEPCYSCDEEWGSCVSRCAEGEPCSDVSPCARGLECVEGACQTRARVGPPCNDLGRCAEGACVYTPPAIAYRDSSLSGLERTCQYLYPIGASSLRAEDCASGLQQRDPPTIGNPRCVPCHSHEDCTNFEGGFISVNPITGFCVDGQCSNEVGFEKRSRPVGAPCGGDEHCRSLNCVSGDDLARCGSPNRIKVFCEVPVIDP